MKTAAIGIGSNSVRMLVADVTDGVMTRIRRERAGTRLFAGLDERRQLSAQSMISTASAVALMAQHARNEGIRQIDLFATSATRDAVNAGEFASLLEGLAGLKLYICSGKEEAGLSFLGATEGEYSGVIDIGGGSTEVIVGKGVHMDASFSCQMGAVRLFRAWQIASREDMPAVIAAADSILAEKLDALDEKPAPPETWVGVGGTFTTLAAMVTRTPWTDRTYTHGTVVHLADAEEHAAVLADMPLEERLKHPGLQPNRADIVVHGICILIACMRRLEIPAITVSEYGNLDGWIKLHHGLCA